MIGIDPFDQPDVEDAKIQTRQLIEAYEKSGALAPEKAFFEDDDVALFAPLPIEGGNLAALLKAHFASARAGNYAGFLVYCERNAADEALVEQMRVAVRDTKKVATIAGFGPRFLHSTGQAYKGGPKTGAVPGDHPRRRPPTSRSRATGELRHRPARAGARRSRRARLARPARAARASEEREDRARAAGPGVEDGPRGLIGK